MTEGPGQEINRSPHSGRVVAVRILAALAVVGVAFAIQRLWLSDDVARQTFGAKVHKIDIDSKILDRQMPAAVVVPRRTPKENRPLLVFLHGRNEDERSYLVDPMFEALKDLRDRAPVVAFPYGGASSYWHNRDSGQWASYVLAELIPKLIRRFDIAPRKIAIGGISMGGFGAYDIARLAPGRFCAIGGTRRRSGRTPARRRRRLRRCGRLRAQQHHRGREARPEPVPGHAPVDRRRRRRPVPAGRQGIRGGPHRERARAGGPQRTGRP